MAVANKLAARLASNELIDEVRGLRAAGAFPYFRVAETATDAVVEIEGRESIMLGSANYLGLANHEQVIDGARKAIDRFGATITGSRLLNGTIDLHVELEAEIADWYGTEAAIVFTTGYQANLGAISGLLRPTDTAVIDANVHASIVDGCRLSGAKVRMFRHNDVDSLAERLDQADRDGGATLVIVDGLYSMGGDLAPVDRISALCRERGAALMVDEAHSVGVLGAQRTGAAELFGVRDDVDILMGSLSKGLGSTGGFIAGSQDVIDTLRISGRSFLFTTAAAPSTLGAALAAVQLQRSDAGRELAERTLANAEYLWQGLRDIGFSVGGSSTLPGGAEIVSPIVPVHVGDDFRAMEMWSKLFEAGIFVSVAMHPAVPRSSAMLRLCLMASHTEEQLERTVKVFAGLPRGLAS